MAIIDKNCAKITMLSWPYLCCKINKVGRYTIEHLAWKQQNKKYTRIYYCIFDLKMIILQKKSVSTKECQNHRALMSKFYRKKTRWGGFTIINLAWKRKKWKKRRYTIIIFAGNLQNYNKMSFTKKTCKNHTAFMAIFCGKSIKWVDH